MKKIYLVGWAYDQENLDYAQEITSLSQGAIQTLSTDKILFDLTTPNKPVLWLQGEQVTQPESIVFFFRNKKENNFFSSLVSSAASLYGYHANNKLFSQHTKNTSKHYQVLRAYEHGFRIAKSFIGTPDGVIENYSLLVEKLGLPFVVKVGGSNRKGVHKVSNKADLGDFLGSLSQNKRDAVLAQEFLPYYNQEYRVVYLYGERLVQLKRPDRDYSGQIETIGELESAELSQEVMHVCDRLYEMSDMDYVAIDIFLDSEGDVVVNEIQSGPSISTSLAVQPDFLEKFTQKLINHFA